MNKEMVKEVMNVEVKDNMEIDVMELVDYMNECIKLNEKIEKVLMNGEKMVYVSNEELLKMSEVLMGLVECNKVKETVEVKNIESDIKRIKRSESVLKKYYDKLEEEDKKYNNKIDSKRKEIEEKIEELGNIENLSEKKVEKNKLEIEKLRSNLDKYISKVEVSRCKSIEKIESKIRDVESECECIEDLEKKKEEKKNKNIDRIRGKIGEYIEIIIRRGGGNKEYWRNIKERVKDWNIEGIEEEIERMIEFSLEC